MKRSGARFFIYVGLFILLCGNAGCAAERQGAHREGPYTGLRDLPSMAELQAVEKQLTETPSAMWAYTAGLGYRQHGELDAALRMARLAVETGKAEMPDLNYNALPLAYVLQGEILDGQGKEEEAVEAYQQAVASYTGLYEEMRLMNTLQGLPGFLDYALDQLERLEKETVLPAGEQPWWGGDYARYLRELKLAACEGDPRARLKAVFPPDVPLSQPVTVKPSADYEAAGDCFLQQGHPGIAAGIYQSSWWREQSMKRDGAEEANSSYYGLSPRGQYKLGGALLRCGQTERAVEHLKKACDRKNPQACVLLKRIEKKSS